MEQELCIDGGLTVNEEVLGGGNLGDDCCCCTDGREGWAGQAGCPKGLVGFGDIEFCGLKFVEDA